MANTISFFLSWMANTRLSHSGWTKRASTQCVLLCCIKPILKKHYGPGGSSREPRPTHQRLKIADIPLALYPLKYSGVSRSSPCTLTTSLAMIIPFSSSSNGPTSTTLDNRDQRLVPWRLRFFFLSWVVNTLHSLD